MSDESDDEEDEDGFSVTLESAPLEVDARIQHARVHPRYDYGTQEDDEFDAERRLGSGADEEIQPSSNRSSSDGKSHELAYLFLCPIKPLPFQDASPLSLVHP